MTRLLLVLCCVVFSNSAFAQTSNPVDGEPDWNGWYWGGQVGLTQIEHLLLETESGPGSWDGFNGVGHEFAHDLSGFNVGLNLGVRSQFDSIVLGVEADVNLHSGSGETGPISINMSTPNNFVSFDARWSASARVMAGVAHNEWLLYGSAGLSWLDGEMGISSWYPLEARTQATVQGVTFGIGLEKQVNERASFAIEFNHTEFDVVKSQGAIPDPGMQVFNFENSATMDAIVVKYRIKFN